MARGCSACRQGGGPVSYIKPEPCPHSIARYGRCQTCGYDFHQSDDGVVKPVPKRLITATQAERWGRSYLDGLNERLEKGHGYAYEHQPHQLHSADVKPTREAWRDALVVRVGGQVYGRVEEYMAGEPWLLLPYDRDEFVGDEERSDEALAALGPVTVVIDADGRNVEAEKAEAELERAKADHAEAERDLDRIREVLFAGGAA